MRSRKETVFAALRALFNNARNVSPWHKILGNVDATINLEFRVNPADYVGGNFFVCTCRVEVIYIHLYNTN
jgi:hypothetical protein